MSHKAPPVLKAVIFDMDGLMFDTEALNMKAWKAAGKRHGYEISDELIYSHIGANVETTKRLMREHLGDDFDFEAVRADRIGYAFRFIEENGMPLKPGLRELLAFLKKKGLRTAVATSSEERFVRFYLEHAQLDHEFDVLVCGDMVKKSKPEPDIFLLALSRLGVSAGEALVLEDSYNGIRAAHRAGIRSVMVPDLLPPTPEMESLFYRRAGDLSGVIPLIEPLLASGKTSETGKIHKIPERSEIEEKYRWNLEDIYPSLEAWEASFAALSPRIGALGAYSGRLGESGDILLAFLRENEAVEKELGRLYVYANMKSHEDLRVTRHQELADRAENLTMRHSAVTAFFQPEILALPEGRLGAFLAAGEAAEELQAYAFYFSELLREKEHVLSRSEEELLARTREIGSVAQNAFTMLTDADIKFPVIQDENGQDVELTEERYYRLSRSRDRNVRKAAFEGIHQTYGHYRNAIGALYAGSVKGDIFYSGARRYANSLESALFADNVPEAVYDNAVQTANDYAPLLHEYMELRKRALGLDELRFYDLNVPLSDEPLTDIPYEEALGIVTEALRPLGPDYAAALKRGFSERWIDVYENQGKRKGAYSWGSYGTRPYVLLNYNGTLRDVFTIAHEMGHSLHSWYSHAAQPQVYADYTILLAEVASTTNEALLLEYLLRKSTEEAERKWLLTYYFDMVRTTFYRQAMFAEYERTAHRRAEAGEALTPALLSELWGGLCAKYYGPAVTVCDSIRMEWARIPHFYTAFYVYKYVTGFTAAGAFASAILDELDEKPAGKETSARERYLTFLKSGASGFSLDILQKAGVDLKSPAPFEKTLAAFGEKLKASRALFPGKLLVF